MSDGTSASSREEAAGAIGDRARPGGSESGVWNLPNQLTMARLEHEWRARDEWSIAAYWCGDKALSARLCRELLADPRLPPEQRERVRANLAFSDGSA